MHTIIPEETYLVEISESFVEVSQHPGGGLISDLDGGLQDALGDDVARSVGCWLGRYVHPVAVIAALAVLLQLLVQLSQPLLDQMDVLQRKAKQ